MIQGNESAFEFGYEVFAIACFETESKVLNVFGNRSVEHSIPTPEILELMEAWKQFLENHNLIERER